MGLGLFSNNAPAINVFQLRGTKIEYPYIMT
jgi:hypothetical protein